MEELTINKTNNYNLFSFIKGNRQVKESAIKKIINSYKQGVDLFKFNPILVDGKYHVYDGQTRFQACKRLGLPIYYMVIKPMDIRSLALLNSSQTTWSREAYLNSFVELGYKDYIYLKDFIKAHDISLAIGVIILGLKDSGNATNLFKEGDFKIIDKIKSNKIVYLYKQIESITGHTVNTHTLRIMIRLINNNSGFDYERFINKLKQIGDIREYQTATHIIAELEYIYNFNVKDKSKLVKLS